MELREHSKLFAKTGYLLKTFSLSFTIFALIPLIVLFFILSQYGANKVMPVARDQFEGLIFIIATTSLALFWGMRRILTKITILSDNLAKVLANEADKQVIFELAQEEGEVAELARAFGEMMETLEKNFVELQEAKKTLHEILAKVGKSLASMENFDLLLYLALEATVDALGISRAAIIAFDQESGFELKNSIGLEIPVQKEIVAFLYPYLKKNEQDKHSLVFVGDKENVASSPEIFSEQFLLVPLICRDKFWGAIYLSGKKNSTDFTKEEQEIVSNLSFQIAIAFETADLNKNVENSYFETIAALALAVDARDAYARGHSERVAAYAIKLGTALGLTGLQIKNLEESARLHDIGKIGIADSILKKPGVFTLQERQIMQNHPVIGENIVKPLKNFERLREPIRHHHEFLDGSGYPDRLKGDQISLLARILTVSDIFDALTSDRTYRKALSLEKALEELDVMVKQGKLEKRVVQALHNLVEDKTL